MLLFILLSSALFVHSSHVSIHLMLLFIVEWLGIQENPNRFQYISCCYLSRTGFSRIAGTSRFQYISCCYLSSNHPLLHTRLLPFQYISCCYLSGCASSQKIFHVVSIHLMLLFISSRKRQKQTRTKVSIHLMLLFITVISFLLSAFTAFQYISCCYLSNQTIMHWRNEQSFNTSHVVIYRQMLPRYLLLRSVSIHLMLLFIA